MSSAEDIAWAAGFFDGEGCITIGREARHTVRIKVKQVEREPLDRFHRIVGAGTVHGPYRHDHGPYRKNCRPIHQFHMGKRADVVRTLNLLLPHLCSAKAERAREALAWIEDLEAKKALLQPNK